MNYRAESSDQETPAQMALTPHALLTIGVTGHRAERLGQANLAAVAARVDQVLGDIERAANALAFPVKLQIMTSLADGGDMIVARQALARGWAVLSVLPFNHEAYRADFKQADDLAAYAHLLSASQTVFALPGEHSPSGMELAYERAGRVILGQCDILTAIWDHAPVRGRGGTAQIAAEAVARDIPVIHIDPAADEPALLWDGLIAHDLGQQSIETVARAGLDALPALLHTLLAPPHAPFDQAMLTQFEQPRQSRRHFAFAYPLLLAIVGVRRLRRADFKRREDAAAEAIFLPSFARVIKRTGAFGARARTMLAPRFAHADSNAAFVAQVFRSSYIANFALSACKDEEINLPFYGFVAFLQGAYTTGV